MIAPLLQSKPWNLGPANKPKTMIMIVHTTATLGAACCNTGQLSNDKAAQRSPTNDDMSTQTLNKRTIKAMPPPSTLTEIFKSLAWHARASHAAVCSTSRHVVMTVQPVQLRAVQSTPCVRSITCLQYKAM
mmetsp:Transcript_15304/g.33133  ORF Transcript_15304/g.33133 Transcript_15304/m.33133 type:complete len:131 (+) Transcript_15304:256-648(+)